MTDALLILQFINSDLRLAYADDVVVIRSQSKALRIDANEIINVLRATLVTLSITFQVYGG